ncbi:MAG: helix-turn-helix transcriptional regulator [Clostridia bacterium]|nr:helix-turn-helix transcriptional regulator [Clostridia bacterium]
MYFGSNMQYLRRQQGITQEKLAERLGVTRQTVGKWEGGEAYPEIPKLLEICELFSCSLDELLRKDLPARREAYSPVEIRRVPALRTARYVMISPNPEDDVQAWMRSWAERSGLTELSGEPMLIGWDFPFVSTEQQNRFGLRGYAAAWVLPEDFTPRCSGAEICTQGETHYAVITIREPFKAPFDLIPGAYKVILEYLHANGFKENHGTDYIPCFEHEYEKDGVAFMDVYIHADCVGRGNLHTGFSC